MIKLSKTVDNLFENVIFKNKGKILANIMMSWSLLIEKDLCEHSHPHKITTLKKSYDTEDRILNIFARNPSVSMQLHYSRDLIVSKVNFYLGYRAISDIRLIVKDKFDSESFDDIAYTTNIL